MARSSDQKRILFVVSDIRFFISHRLAIAHCAQEQGYEIAVACPSDPSVQKLNEEGIAHIPITMGRGARNVFAELKSLISIFRVVKKFKPDLLHLITSKPIIFGGMVGRVLRVPSVSAITGLGFVFIHNTAKARILRILAITGYRMALHHKRAHLIFQNSDDEAIFVKHKIPMLDQVHRIGGSGADLTKITEQPLPKGTTVVALPARLLKDKGVVEFAQAAQILKSKGVNATFRLIGDPDPNNPSSLSEAEIRDWVAQGWLEWHRHTPDINTALAQVHIVALPSYREGFPKTLIDAAAAGRVSVASDVAGCRDALEVGVTGELFKVKDAHDMAQVLEPLINDRARQIVMGANARRHAEAHFDIQDVCDGHLAIYQTMLS